MSRSQYDEARFQAAVDRIMMLASVAPPLVDIDFVIRELEKANDFGVFTDPTLWNKTFKDREALMPFVRAAHAFVHAAGAFAQRRGEILVERARAGLLE